MKVQLRTNGTPVTVGCPYCGMETRISALATEAGCKHFEDFTLFTEKENEFSEIEYPEDRVDMCEAIFRLKGSRFPALEVRRKGEIVELGEDSRLTVNGKFEGFIDTGDIMNMLSGEDDDDVEYVRGN